MFTEIEHGAPVDRAVSTWRRKFVEGAANSKPFGKGILYDRPELGIWGHFGYGRYGGYWNVFGRSASGKTDSRLIVEVNPPLAGVTTDNVVGVVARSDRTGALWMLHRGRLHEAQFNITAQMFASETRLRAAEVRRHGGKTELCFPVVDLSASARSVQRATAHFVEECARIRARYGDCSKPLAKMAAEFADIDPTLSKNADGHHMRAPQGSVAVNRRHDGVRDALAGILRNQKIGCLDKPTNGLAPDLYTETILFEIKTDTSTATIQHAVGQLAIYEAALEQRLTKVLVIPGQPSSKALVPILRALGVAVLPYALGPPIVFERILARLLGQV